ncbi:NAD(P)H-binding protein [Nocardia bovistercoris]|uniref:NAD(P)H-binding protein n=1 Tax=Nocardia bovistercoris TaxID=2785916 RepID=A0A931IFN1_9NOCA|nr:NAD(P)H-binding protein [Nocardia bovistercoris]MBH0779566.1 NAD(P)H-binding protein [Nocardia bovistercoris]
MVHIVEFSPVFAEAADERYHHVNGIWNAREQTERLARERGHAYVRPEDGGVTVEFADRALLEADALILAPTVATAAGMWQPADGAAAGRVLGHRVLDRIAAARPDLHIVLVSHFLVGHGVAHRNAKPNTWSLRALEAHLRAGPNPWTILRPTWLSTIHDPSYQTRLTGDRHADGLVSTDSVAATVLTAIEHREAAAGRTAAIFNLSIPETGATDLVAEFTALERDFEAELAGVTE